LLLLLLCCLMSGCPKIEGASTNVNVDQSKLYTPDGERYTITVEVPK
jgi:hypothetical protein